MHEAVDSNSCIPGLNTRLRHWFHGERDFRTSRTADCEKEPPRATKPVVLDWLRRRLGLRDSLGEQGGLGPQVQCWVENGANLRHPTLVISTSDSLRSISGAIPFLPTCLLFELAAVLAFKVRCGIA